VSAQFDDRALAIVPIKRVDLLVALVFGTADVGVRFWQHRAGLPRRPAL
jgi:hypothetical protein